MGDFLAQWNQKNTHNSDFGGFQYFFLSSILGKMIHPVWNVGNGSQKMTASELCSGCHNDVFIYIYRYYIDIHAHIYIHLCRHGCVTSISIFILIFISIVEFIYIYTYIAEVLLSTMRHITIRQEYLFKQLLGGGFKTFLSFTPTWGNDPTWLIFFKGV